MRTNSLKAALKSGKPQVGTWLSLADLHASRVLARTGLSFLTVDLEHAPIDWQQAASLFAVIADAGCVPLARVPEGMHHLIKRVLDAGAFGIVVPMVDTVEQARAAIAAAKYPPQGTRSVGGAFHAVNFNATPAEYYRRANDEILVVLQLESPRGLENAEEICQLPGADAFFVGPNDLRAQMRAPDGTDPTPEEFEAALQRMLAISKRHNFPIGIHAKSVEEVQMRLDQGWNLMAMGSDLSMLLTEAQRVVSALNLAANTKSIANY